VVKPQPQRGSNAVQRAALVQRPPDQHGLYDWVEGFVWSHSSLASDAGATSAGVYLGDIACNDIWFVYPDQVAT